MSKSVVLDDVRHRIAEFGPRATLVTVDASNLPHTVTAIVEVTDSGLATTVGSRTRANVEEHPGVSLVWHPTGDGEYQLILDGTAEPVGDADPDDGVATLEISITSGILHRLAGLSGDAPSCIAIGDPQPASPAP
ncbi:MAG: pyridoxamine 5'-phosphate oxidase family protein [Ilumatobacteraceae bacterium]